MTALAITDNQLVSVSHGRRVVIQRVTASDRYTALRVMGLTEAVAAGVVAKLIIVKVRAG